MILADKIQAQCGRIGKPWLNRSGPGGGGGTLYGGRVSVGESAGCCAAPPPRRGGRGSAGCRRRGLLEVCSAVGTRASPSGSACSLLPWKSRSVDPVELGRVATVLKAGTLRPPRRCRTSPGHPCRGSSGAFSTRKGGCTSCRILSPGRCTACLWCGRACASFGRLSWQNVGHSPRSRTQTVSRLEIGRVRWLVVKMGGNSGEGEFGETGAARAGHQPRYAAYEE